MNICQMIDDRNKILEECYGTYDLYVWTRQRKSWEGWNGHIYIEYTWVLSSASYIIKPDYFLLAKQIFASTVIENTPGVPNDIMHV